MIYSTDVSSYGRVYTDVSTFYLNPNDPYFIRLSQLLLKQVCNHSNGRITFARKIQLLKYLVVYTVPILVSTGYKKNQLVQSTQVSRLQRVRKLFCLGQPQSAHVILSPFFQPLYSTVLNEESTSLLPFLSRRAASNYWSTASKNLRIFAILLCDSTVHILRISASLY